MKQLGYRIWACLLAASCVLLTGDTPRTMFAATAYTVSFQTYDDHWVSPLCCGQSGEVWADSATKVPIILTDLNGGALKNNGDQITLHTSGTFGGTRYFTTANGASPLWTSPTTAGNSEKWRIYQSPYNGNMIIEGPVHVQNVATGKYWIADNCGGSTLSATSSSAGSNCNRFEIDYN